MNDINIVGFIIGYLLGLPLGLWFFYSLPRIADAFKQFVDRMFRRKQ